MTPRVQARTKCVRFKQSKGRARQLPASTRGWWVLTKIKNFGCRVGGKHPYEMTGVWQKKSFPYRAVQLHWTSRRRRHHRKHFLWQDNHTGSWGSWSGSYSKRYTWRYSYGRWWCTCNTNFEQFGTKSARVRTLLVFRTKDLSTIGTGEFSFHVNILHMSPHISSSLMADWAVSTPPGKFYKTLFSSKVQKKIV